MHVCAKLLPSHQLCSRVDDGYQAPLSMGFSRQEYWSGLPCPSPGKLPNPGTEPTSLTSHWQVGSLPLAPPGKPPGECTLRQISPSPEKEGCVH